MENKEIYINGVDVNGCECIIEDYQRANNFKGRYEHIKNVCELGERGAEYYNLFCKDNPNCYYKKLKRAEAQCEAMFVSHTDLEKKYKAKEQECEELKDNLPNAITRLMGELDQLKAENKHLNDLLNQALKELEELQEGLTNG